MRKFVLAVAAILVSTAAWADDQAQLAAAPTVDSHMAAALDLLDANGSMNNLGTMLDALAPIEAQDLKRQLPNLNDAAIATMQKFIRNAIVAREDEYKRIIAGVYAAHFSEEELKTLAAFYRSDVGKKYIGSMPALIREVTPVGATWARSVAGDAIQNALSAQRHAGEHT